MPQPTEIALKATELLEEMSVLIRDMNVRMLDLEGRIKNVELTNRLLVAELRKLNSSGKPNVSEKINLIEQKSAAPQPDQAANSSVPIGLVTQKLVWNIDGSPIRMAYVEIVARNSSQAFRKKTTTLPSGMWQVKDVPFGEYDLTISKEPVGDKPAINYKTSFIFSQSPLDLGIAKLESS